MNSLKIPVLFTFLALGACTKSVKTSTPELSDTVISQDPAAPALSPEESMKTIRVPDGYRLELVASEPMVQEPVAVVWDGNGRIYVAEMRTYMQDIDGTGTRQPASRIMLLEDTNGDGKMDKHSVFIDSLVLPRMMLPINGKLLVNETYNYNLWSYEDTNGDGKADKKEQLYHSNEADTRNLEHQGSGLDWNLDNYIYVTRSPFRYRFHGGKIGVDSLYDPPGGQWGLTHDNYGRLFYSWAGAEIPAMGFQQNPVYGILEMPDQYQGDFESVWPIVGTPDVQGGPKRIRADNTLNHFTASCGQSIFRGDRLPEDLRGDLLICEPVGRLIRRARVMNREGKIVLINAYYKKEFIAATDLNFRPVNTATGPDGCLYVVDMYRGIIQESDWTKEGSYLRPEILRKKLDKNIGRGRIYRLVHQDYKPGKKPDMLTASSEKLIRYLGHPNGWWRDNAQRLLILRGDKRVVPALKEVFSGKQKSVSLLDRLFGKPEKTTMDLARLHALWTLEGLESIDREIIERALQDQDAQIRKAAIILTEPYLKSGDTYLLQKLAALQTDASPDVLIQLALSLRYSKTAEAKNLLNQLLDQNAANAVLVASAKNSLLEEPNELKLLKGRIAGLHPMDRVNIVKGYTTFKNVCGACHGPDGKGIKIGMGDMIAPPLNGSKRVNSSPEVLVKILLHGLSGPIDGKTYPDIMPPMSSNSDKWIAEVTSYVRTNLGNKAGPIRPPLVKAIRDKSKGRNKYWTLAELKNYQNKRVEEK